MVVAAVSESTGTECLFDVREIDRIRMSERRRHLERGEDLSSVAGRSIDQKIDGVIGRTGGQSVEAAHHETPGGDLRQRFETEQGAARPQWSVHFEERILGRGTDEGDGAVFDCR